MHKLFNRKKYFLQDGNSNLVDNLDWLKNKHTKSLDKTHKKQTVFKIVI